MNKQIIEEEIDNLFMGLQTGIDAEIENIKNKVLDLIESKM